MATFIKAQLIVTQINLLTGRCRFPRSFQSQFQSLKLRLAPSLFSLLRLESNEKKRDISFDTTFNTERPCVKECKKYDDLPAIASKQITTPYVRAIRPTARHKQNNKLLCIYCV